MSKINQKPANDATFCSNVTIPVKKKAMAEKAVSDGDNVYKKNSCYQKSTIENITHGLSLFHLLPSMCSIYYTTASNDTPSVYIYFLIH